jgi:hypothetical protein
MSLKFLVLSNRKDRVTFSQNKGNYTRIRLEVGGKYQRLNFVNGNSEMIYKYSNADVNVDHLEFRNEFYVGDINLETTNLYMIFKNTE